jgi:hypothetical protein
VIVAFKMKNCIRVIGTDCETPAGAAGQVRLMQAFTPKMLTTRPAESEHLRVEINHTEFLGK